MGFVKGQSGNPNGAPPRYSDAATLAKEHTLAAVKVLVEKLASKDENVALRAANSILDRGWGKPKETHAVTVNMVDDIYSTIAGRSAEIPKNDFPVIQ